MDKVEAQVRQSSIRLPFEENHAAATRDLYNDKMRVLKALDQIQM